MESNVTALQLFPCLFIIMSNTVFLSIVHKATSTQPVSRVISQQEASFCDAPERFLVVSVVVLSPHLGEGGWEGTLQTLQCRRCPLPISSRPSFTQHLLGCFMYPRTHCHFLAPVSADKQPGHRCPLCPSSPRTHLHDARGEDGAAPQEPLGDNPALAL